jgi:hypothetical protein
MGTMVQQCVPPLVAGDKLTRAEFLRRWEAHPEIKLAELIGGIVFMPSPVSLEHGDIHLDVGGWLFTYKVATPGTAGGYNTTSLLLKDAPQSDLNLRILPEYGGTSRREGRYLGGRPELLVEVCASSASYDLHAKLRLYEAAGSRNTSPCSFLKTRCAGMHSHAADTNSFHQIGTASYGRRVSSRACGWIAKRFWKGIPNRSWPGCRKDCNPRSTSALSPSWPVANEPGNLEEGPGLRSLPVTVSWIALRRLDFCNRWRPSSRIPALP